MGDESCLPGPDLFVTNDNRDQTVYAYRAPPQTEGKQSPEPADPLEGTYSKSVDIRTRGSSAMTELTESQGERKTRVVTHRLLEAASEGSKNAR